MTKRKIVVGISGLVIVGAIWLLLAYLLSLLSQPSTARVSVGEEKSSLMSYSIDLTPVPTSGNYVSFNYPKGLPLISRSIISPISVEDFTFYVKDVASWTMGVDIIRTPTGNLSESSSYTLRKNNPQTYSESQLLISGAVVKVMIDTSVTGGFSKVAYFTHGNLVAIISLLGNDASGTQPLQTTFTMLLNSLHWLRN